MASIYINQNEYEQFCNIPYNIRAVCMTLYLIGDGRRSYSMQDVGRRVFGDENRSYTVSLICRCYNFSGRNGGKYQSGCAFEKKYGYCVSQNDIEDFIAAYPNGTFQNGVTFEDFLLSSMNVSSNPRFQNQNQVFCTGNHVGVQQSKTPRSQHNQTPRPQQNKRSRSQKYHDGRNSDPSLRRILFWISLGMIVIGMLIAVCARRIGIGLILFTLGMLLMSMRKR